MIHGLIKQPFQRLLLQGQEGLLEWFTSSIPGLGESLRTPELESEDKIKAIIETRKRIEESQRPLLSVLNRFQDVLPAASLQLGVTRSQAVCRIAQYFSLEEFRSFIGEFRQSTNRLVDATNPNSREQLQRVLQEIFLIPEQLFNEIFERRTLIDPLDALEMIEAVQLVQINPIPRGTGFLVGGSHLLTNHHVVRNQAIAAQCIAQFDYIEDEHGAIQQPIGYEFDSESLFISEPELDYTLVQLKSTPSIQPAGYRFGWIQLVEQEDVVIPNDNIFLVHHPKGGPKRLDVNNNSVIENGLYKEILRYQMDADYGSSGGSAFNTQWRLVALHHAAVPVVQAGGKGIQQGVRICRVVEDLKQKQSSEPNLQSFVENFVVSSECLNYPALWEGLRFDGIDDYISIDSKVSFASCATNFGEDSGSQFANEGVSTIKFWNSSGIELRSLNHPGVQKIEFSSDDEYLASSGSFYSSEVRLWNTETGKLIQVLSIDNEDTENFVSLQSVSSLSFHPNLNKLLAVANIFGDVTLWDINTGDWLNSQSGSLLIRYPQLSELKGSIVKFSPDGSFLAVANEESVQLWKPSNWSLQKIEVNRSQTVCFSANRKTLAIATQDGFLQFFDLETSVLSEKIRANKRSINQIKFIAVGGSFENETLLSFGSEGLVRFWSLDGHLIEEIRLDPKIEPREIQSIDFSPDGKTLIIFGLSTEISLVNIETQEIKTIKHFKQTMQRKGADFPYADVKFNTHVLPTGFANFAAIETTQSFTVEAWINPDVNGGGAIFDCTLEFAQGRAGKFVLSITPQNDVSGSLKTSLSGAQGSTLESGAGEVLLGKFNHVAAVVEFQEDSEKVTCYVNGRSTGEISSSPSQATICEFFPRLQVIGASFESADFAPSLSNFFKGIISEIRLWNTARTSEQLVGNMYRPLIAQEIGLIGHWKFEEGLGDKIFNLSSNLEDYGLAVGTKRLMTNQLPFFPLPIGLSFSETGDYVNCGNDLNFNTGQITVEAWIKHQYGNCLIISCGLPNEHGYSLILNDGKVRVILWDENSIEKTTIVDTRSLAPQDHVWHHVAFTWNNNSSEISIYIDGRLQDSVVVQGRSKTITSAGKSLTFGLFTGDLSGLVTDLLIGCKDEFNGGTRKGAYYNVAITDVRLWNVCRPQDQIKANMSRRLNSDEEKDKNLIGYWRLDEGNDDRVINLVSQTPATIHGAKWFPMLAVSEQTATAQPS